MALIQCDECKKEISDKSEKCIHCGCPIKSIQSAQQVDVLLGMAKTAEAGQNSQEAEKYYAQVLEIDPTIVDAWYGKGKAAGWQSSIGHIRLAETLAAFINALANTPDDAKPEMIAACMSEINVLVSTLYGMARKHMLEFVSLPKAWEDYIGQVWLLLQALEDIFPWNPHDRATLENIVHLCKDNIEGVTYRDQFDNNTPKGWRLSPEYEKVMREKMQRAAQNLQQIDPKYVLPDVEVKKPGNCFVVTATMGDALHPKVLLLRRLRDEWVKEQKWGKTFIRWYYKHGPNLAEIISKNKMLRMLSYGIIVAPAAIVARHILKKQRRRATHPK